MAGNQGDQGDQDNQGDIGVVGTGGSGWRFADRVDLPFITEKEPGTGKPIAEQRTGRTSFGQRNWDPGWDAWRAVADFGLTDWRHAKQGIKLPDPDHFQKLAGKTPDQEIEDLHRMALDERPDALAEIVDQKEEFISYFLAACGGRRTTHPQTYRLFCIATLVSSVAVMHFKGEKDRARPAHVAPGLMPPLESPGHGSYPSGHATQAHLFALCAIEMLPGTLKQSLGVVVNALAARIARNREIAGLHYISDSMAGQWLANEVFKILNDQTKMPRFSDTMKAAKAEWECH